MLELKDIVKKYDMGSETVAALKGISISFRESEFVAVLGHSGCGKTTLLNIIGGLDHCTSGDLVINGLSTKEYKDRDWDTYRNHTIGFVFQSYNLIPHQSVLQNVELALSLSGVSKAQQRERAIEALRKVGLGDQLNKRPGEMSGGQMQRVAIARAIVNDPGIILADEPTGALDSETSVQVMDILKEISKDRLVIMVTHNPELAEKYATRIVRMKDGHITGDTSPMSDDEIAHCRALASAKSGAGRKIKKPSMSFATSFGLSLKNLFTKKGRTALTAFAGSIGIIGIALIFAVSQGMTDYIDTVQEDTLSTYPLSIMSETADMTSMLAAFGSAMSDDESLPENTVKEQQLMSQVFAQVGSNDLQAFKQYMDENMDLIKDDLNALQYGYNVSPQIYTTDVNGEILRVNPSDLFSSFTTGASVSMSMGSTNIFSEMIDNRELLESQYDVLAGRWPESYNEMILVLSDSDGMTDYMAYALGLRDQEELEDMMTQVMQGNEVEDPDNPMTWTYDDLMSLSFTLINAGDTYKYNSDYDIWEDMSEDQEYMQNLMSQGEKLTIVGIVCPKAGVAASALTPGVAYTSDLTEHVMENAEKSQIVQQQLQQPDLDVFTGRTFEELENEEGAGLDFNDMISVDTEALSSAFGMDVDEDDMNEMVQSYMSDISSSITADTKPAETAFTDTLSNMLSEMLTDYWDENGGGSGIATISAGDVNGVVSSYLESAGAQSLMSQLEKDYGVPVSVFTQTYSQLLSGIVSGYITTASGDGGSAPLTPEIISALIESVSSNQGVLAVAQVMGKSMTEAAMQTTILTKVGQMSQELITSIAGSFNVDPEQIASAFNFELSEDELSRLMDAFSSQGNERSLESNLSTLGYADRDNPYSISVYLVDFTAKEHFIDFIENYNETVEAQGNEELVISYTDITGILISSVKTVVDSISYVLIAFVAISLIVSSIMIGVITLISVQERTKEIGILRALGASKRNVSSMFNAETGIIGFASGVLGIVITYLLCIPIDMILHSVTGISNLSTHLPVVVAGVLVVISVLLTLISGIIPSRSAAKKDPVEALRTE